MTREGLVVLGCARSGTTLVRRLLDAHPDIACPPETGLFSASARFLDEQPFPTGIRFGAVPGLAQLGVDEATVLRNLREMCLGYLRDYATANGARLWAEKTVSDVFALPSIERLLGDEVFFLGVVRHGLDVVVSQAEFAAKAGAWPSELFEFVRQDPRPLLGAVRAWNHATTLLIELAERRPDAALLLRYEDLIADPEGALAPIWERLGVPAIPPTLDPAGKVGFGDYKTWGRDGVHGKSARRYERDLSRGDLALLAPLVNPVLERAGYERVKEPRVPTLASAQRRLEMGMRLAANERVTD